jgi:ZIP family zinc transporter
LNTTVLGLFFGTVGTALGGYIGIKLKKKSNRFLSFILEFAAGLMIAVVCFSLIPEALDLSNIVIVLFGIIFGVIIMIFCDNIIKGKFDRRKVDVKTSLLKTGIAVGVRVGIA